MKILTPLAVLPSLAIAMAALGVLVLISAWVFSPPKKKDPVKPLTAQRTSSAQTLLPEHPSESGDYGLLELASRHVEEARATADRKRLQLHRVRATLGREGSEYLVLVFPSDVQDAKRILALDAS